MSSRGLPRSDGGWPKSRAWLSARMGPPQEGGCRLWLGDKGAGSRVKYGRIRDRATGRVYMATHAVYTEFVGPIPPGKMLLHSCDNGICVNPEHLRPGTHAENTQDRIDRDRSAWGESHPQAKLTAEQAQSIHADPRSQREIAAAYGISQTQVSRIKNRLRWKGVARVTPMVPLCIEREEVRR